MLIHVFSEADKQNSCAALVTGKAVNRCDREAMQVPRTLSFDEKKKHVIALKNELGAIDK